MARLSLNSRSMSEAADPSRTSEYLIGRKRKWDAVAKPFANCTSADSDQTSVGSFEPSVSGGQTDEEEDDDDEEHGGGGSEGEEEDGDEEGAADGSEEENDSDEYPCEDEVEPTEFEAPCGDDCVGGPDCFWNEGGRSPGHESDDCWVDCRAAADLDDDSDDDSHMYARCWI